MTDRPVALFAYGTLQQPNVQRATFNRLLEGAPDALVGYTLAPLEIRDEYVVATSGLALHTAAQPSGDPADRVLGTVYSLTDAELAAADLYEVDDMMRIELTLASGARAFVYVRKPVEEPQ